jgi:hypothetical protein
VKPGISLCLLLLSSFIAGAQPEYVKTLQKKLAQLEKNGVDTLLIVNQSCSGCISGWQPAGIVFWKKSGHVYYHLYTDYLKASRDQSSNYDPFVYFFENEGLSSEVVDTVPELNHYRSAELYLKNKDVIYDRVLPEMFEENMNTSWLRQIDSFARAEVGWIPIYK